MIVRFGLVLTALAVLALGLLLRLFYRHSRRVETAFRNALSQLELLQQAFHQFAPQDVVEDIIRRGISIHGERREVTVLFADIVGFTDLSERTDPEVVVKVLNGYFRAMSQAISSHNGHVSKFMGDGIMAMFGAPEPDPWQAMDAVLAALEMRKALTEYNQELTTHGFPALAIGVGIHRGPMIAGVFGSSELMEYTVIGDVVNTASRIEHLTREEHVDILISEVVASALDERFVLEAMPPAEVKGKHEKVVTHFVKSFRE